jgi:hypothetical protein
VRFRILFCMIVCSHQAVARYGEFFKLDPEAMQQRINSALDSLAALSEGPLKELTGPRGVALSIRAEVGSHSVLPVCSD